MSRRYRKELNSSLAFNIMIRWFSLFLLFNLCFQSHLFAAQKINAVDKIVGSTFKTLAKAFVAASDINALKKNNIAKINKMTEEKFRKRYDKVYAVLKGFPDKLKADYGINQAMTKEQAIKSIELLDKDKAYTAIDFIPDEIIAAEFKRYLVVKGGQIQKSSLIKQINNLWRKISVKAKA